MSSGAVFRKSTILAACAVLIGNGNAAGAGYAILEQSVKGMGTAYAGGAAAADDASTIFYNPAGLTRLPGSQAVAGIHLVVPTARFRNEGSTNLAGQALSGGEGGNAGKLIAIPNLYYSQQLNERMHVGLGVFSPFGLITEYDATWVGRYHATKSELASLNVNPAIGCRITDKLSLGAGLNAQYIKAELGSAIDFGAIFGALGAPGLAPQSSDGFVTFKGTAGPGATTSERCTSSAELPGRGLRIDHASTIPSPAKHISQVSLWSTKPAVSWTAG